MPNDFKKREPSKTEKIIYELFLQQQGMERNLFTNSSLLVSLAMLLDIKPEKLSGMLINNNDKIKEYSAKLNEEIGKLEKIKYPEYEHDHEGHDHEHQEESSEPTANQ